MSCRLNSFLILMLYFSSMLSFSQQPGKLTNSNKALKHFQKAGQYYLRRDYLPAVLELNKALEADPAFGKAYALKGDIYADLNKFQEAIGFYETAITVQPGLDQTIFMILGNLNLSTGRYEDSKRYYEKYLESENTPLNRRSIAENNILRCDFGIRAMQRPVPFEPVNLGDSINTEHDEYINTITADGQTIYFTRRLPTGQIVEDLSGAVEEDFYITRLSADSVWGKAVNLGPPVNTRGNEGALSASPDRQYLFFAACQRSDGFGSCDLYWSHKSGDNWLPPENMGDVINSSTWDSQPSFSSDGKTLYFVSKRPGGKGASDIWKSALQPDGSWNIPVNLGDSVNTAFDEQAPFIHPDDRTLYFSSKGHLGMGGLDLFFTRKNEDGSWKQAENIGYPVNTWSDEIALIVDAGGRLAYISSDMEGGKGRQDIYSFELNDNARPLPVTYLKGTVYDKDTGKKLKASFELSDIKNKCVVVNSFSDPVDGAFLVCIPTDLDYALTVSKEGYLFYSDHFSLSGLHDAGKPFLKNIPLQPVKIGETVILRNIFFDTDRYDLKPESYMELERLTLLLKQNPSLKIEISGHTDIVGSEEHNLELSGNRAKAVFDYLAGQGISAGRMTYAGFGFSKPVDTNETEEGKANNRRTEFRIIDK